MSRRPASLPLPRHPAVWLLAGLFAFSLAGCSSLPAGRAPRAAEEKRTSELPARIVGHLFLVEAVQSDGRLRRFLVDTGSSVSYASPGLAGSLAQKERTPRTARVESADGGVTTLPAVTLRRLRLGEAHFERVPAAVFDFAELSAHLGLPIDGLLGFPLFRDHVMTLDYPRARLVLAPPSTPAPAGARASTLAFNNEQRVPFIPVQLGNESFAALIDTGSDGALTLNPLGLHPRFQAGPRPGAVVSSLAGDRAPLIGRLDQEMLIGTHVVSRPIVDLTQNVSALGGELLRHFALTFDQRRNLVTFVREPEGAVVLEPRRSTGLGFARAPARWRVIAVVPGTPASALGVQPGELVVRINGEPVDQWDHERFARLLVTAAKVTFTFLAGAREIDREVPVFDLVP